MATAAAGPGTGRALPTLQGSNAGKFHNVAPQIPAAGKLQSNPLDTVGTCVSFPDDRPETPDRVAPYRKSRREVGRTVVPSGKARDAGPPDIRFGRRGTSEASALELIRTEAGTKSRFLQKQQELKEASVYASSRLEPVGRSGRVADDGKTHGMVTKSSESSKKVMYPYQDKDEEEEAIHHSRYCKTHNSYGPGVQRKRDYDWKKHGVDPKEHRFGYVVPSDADGVRQAMSYGGDTKTNIVKKSVEDFRDVAKDELGKTRNQGFGEERRVPPNYTFGSKQEQETWGVKECMTAHPATPEELQDKSLGRSTRPGYRNDTSSDRIFGVPTVRTDLSRPATRKVTDNNNYGDDSTARSLICPSKYASRNVLEEDFLHPISKEEMYDLAQGAQFALDDDEFEEVWQEAAATSADGVVCIETFRRAADKLGI